MKSGIIDIGSNTIKFKIFDSDEMVFKKIFPVQIGKGLQGKVISDECLKEIDDCFYEIQSLAKSTKIVKIIGTSALRDAENSDDVFDMVIDRFDLHLEVIQGSEEAELIYKGVRKGIRSEKNYLICDIGGGSVELIYCNNKEIIKLKSFELGVIKLHKLREKADPYSEDDIQFYLDYLDQELSEFLLDVKTNHLVGAAGSFESLITLNQQKEFDSRFQELKVEDLNRVIDLILKSSLSERNENQLIPIERKVFLPLGSILVKYLLNKLEINKFTFSPNSLIEGLF